MDDLIRDLLDYARVNRAEIKQSEVDLDAVLDTVMESMSGDLRERKAVVERTRPLGTVMAHEPMLNQVITNLLSNAVKFVPREAIPKVAISSASRNGRVRLSFKDNGIGIAPEHHDRIFGIFERLNRSEDYPGTGIGLAIVRRAVERLGGSVGVESKPEEGSTFWVELPVS
jgi:signal transduction histidine kinase